jgi:hypothetical protein
MDNDASMIESLGLALTSLQIKFRGSSIRDRMLIRPTLEGVLDDYAEYQIRLLKEGVIVSDEDLSEMKQIRDEIDEAAKTQQLIQAIARLSAFVALRV